MHRDDATAVAILVIWGLGVLLTLAGSAAFVYIVIHFALKFW